MASLPLVTNSINANANSPLPPSAGGTGIGNQNTATLTMADAITFTGDFPFTATLTGTTTVTFPTSGTLATTTQLPFTNQNPVTGSRALNTVYQNTGTKPIFVTISVISSSGTNNYITNAYTDSSTPPGTQVANCNSIPNPGGSLGATSMSFIVLPGNYYEAQTTGATLNNWIEWT